VTSVLRNRDCSLPFALLLGGVILGSGYALDLATLRGLAQEYLALLPDAAGVAEIRRWLDSLPAGCVGDQS
jgi:hypothetical protein